MKRYETTFRMETERHHSQWGLPNCLSVSVLCVSLCICIDIYIYIERERERENEGHENVKHANLLVYKTYIATAYT